MVVSDYLLLVMYFVGIRYVVVVRSAPLLFCIYSFKIILPLACKVIVCMSGEYGIIFDRDIS